MQSADCRSSDSDMWNHFYGNTVPKQVHPHYLSTVIFEDNAICTSVFTDVILNTTRYHSANHIENYRFDPPQNPPPSKTLWENFQTKDLADALCFFHLMSLPMPGSQSPSVLHRQNLLQAALRASSDSDVLGGSDDGQRKRILENRDKARCRKMSKVVCRRKLDGMQTPHRMDGVDSLVPTTMRCSKLVRISQLWRGCTLTAEIVTSDLNQSIMNISSRGGRPTAQWPALSTTLRIHSMLTWSLTAWLGADDGHEQDIWFLNAHKIPCTKSEKLIQMLLQHFWRGLAMTHGSVTGSNTGLIGFRQCFEIWSCQKSKSWACGSAIGGTLLPMVRTCTISLKLMSTAIQYRNAAMLPAVNGCLAGVQDWVDHIWWRREPGRIHWAVNRGELAMIDWKRTANLASKYSSPQALKPPLHHLADCGGQRYTDYS